MKNFNFFEKLWEHGRTLRRVGLVLVMCLMAIPQVWAWTPIYFNGNFTGNNWNGATYQINYELEESNSGHYFYPFYNGSTGNKYWRLYAEKDYVNYQLSPSSNNYVQDVGTVGYKVTCYKDWKDYNFKTTNAKVGVIAVHINQGDGNGDLTPGTWLERPTIYIWHNWGGNTSNWGNNGGSGQKSMTDKEDGTYTYDGVYSASGTNVGIEGTGPIKKYFADNATTLVGSPASGNKCRFTWNSNGYKGYDVETNNRGSLTITKLCQITYNGNGKTGGSVPSNQNDIMYNTTTTVRGNTGTLVKTNYVFTGWNANDSGTGAHYDAGTGTINPTAVTTTLYAEWQDEWNLKGSWDSWVNYKGMPNVSSNTFQVTLSLAADATYEFKVVQRQASGDTYYGKTSTLFTRDNLTSVKNLSTDGATPNMQIRTDVAGDYTFTFIKDGSASNMRVLVKYPCATAGKTLFKFTTKSSGLGTGNVCTSSNVDKVSTTNDDLSALAGGTLTARSEGSNNRLKYAESAFTFDNGDRGVLRIDLDCPLQTGDVIRYINSANNASYNAYIRHTSSSTATDQLTLPGLNASIAEVVVPSGFNNKSTIYVTRGSSNGALISHIEIIRPYVVTLDASTNGGQVNGNNTEVHYMLASESLVLPHADKTNYRFKGWYTTYNGSTSPSNPYTPTANATLYAQFEDCPSSDATVYKFQLKTTLSNEAAFGGVTGDYETDVTNYLSTLIGGTLLTHQYGSNLTVVSKSKFQFGSNNEYLKVDLDCALETGDKFITTIGNDELCVTTSSTRDNTYKLYTGSSTTADIPAAFVGAKTLYIWRDGTDPQISYFEVYRPAKYTITYAKGSADGASGDSFTGTKIHEVDFTLSSADDAFTRTGYTYDGWSTSADGSTDDYELGGTYSTDDDITLYPHWVEDAPSCATPTSLTNGTTRYDSQAVSWTAGDSETAWEVYVSESSDTPAADQTPTSTPITASYIFTGLTASTDYYWWVRAKCGDSDKSDWVAGTSFTTSASVVITGAINTSGYGTVSPSSITVTSGSTVSLSSNVLTCDGKTITATYADATTAWSYAFSSWSGVTDGGTVSSATTATANFTRTGKSYTITLDKQVASNTPTGSVSATYGSAMPSIATLPSHANYTFCGFYTNVAGGGTCYYNGSGVSQQNSDFTSTSTLYAKFTQSVTLNDNHGGDNNGSATATYAGTLSSISAPEYSGHTVDGYYAESGCSNLVMTDAGVLQTSVTDGSSVVWTDENSKWKHAAASTLYAHWKCDAPTISCTNNVVTITGVGTIYYTTDGSTTPTSGSTAYDPENKPVIAANTTIKAICIESGCENSDVATQACTYSPRIIYNANLTGTSGSTAEAFATEAAKACGFSKANHKFKWWNTASNGTGEDFYVGESVTLSSSDVNLYAQWDTTATGWAYWVGDVAISDAATAYDVAGNSTTMQITRESSAYWNSDISKDYNQVSKYNSTTAKKAKVLAIDTDDSYIEIKFKDGSTINDLYLGITSDQTSTQNFVVCYSTTADFTSGAYEFVKVGSTDNVVSVPGHDQAKKSTTHVAPSTTNKYKYVRVYRKLKNGSGYNSTGGDLGCGNKARIYSIKAKKGETNYTISFADNGADGGSAMTNVTDIVSGSDANLPENTWEKTEHTFAGWKTNVALTYVEKGGEDEINVAADGIVPNEATIKNITGNITLTAQWQVNEYTVHFWVGIDVSVEGRFSTYEYGEEKVLPTTVLRSGYLFDGWYDNSSLTGDPVTQMPADATGEQSYYPKWKALSAKCLYITGEVIDAYNDVAADPGYYMLNDVKYVFGEGYDDNEDALVLPSTADPSYIYIDPKVGTLKEVQLHISDIADKNTADKGISWGFDEDDSDVGSVGLSDLDEISDHEFSFRPTDVDQQCFVFQPHATTLTIDNICVFYEAKTYSVTYDRGTGASGTAPSDLTTYYYNDVVTVADTTGTGLKKTGCTFRGWLNEDSHVFYQIGDEFAITGNTTLTAVWEGAGGTTTTLSWFDNSSTTTGSSSFPSGNRALYAYTESEKTNAYTMTSNGGSNFKGMTSDFLDAGDACIAVEETKFVDIYADNLRTSSATTFSDITSISLKIMRKHATKYSTFTIKIGSDSIAKHVSLSDANNTSFTTYLFNNFGTKSGVIRIINEVSGSDYRFVADDIAITCGSGSSNYTVTFADGTSVDPDDHDVWPNNIVGVPSGALISTPADPIAIGYAFFGWYKDAACSEQPIKLDTLTVRGNMTIYAKWEENVHTFTGGASTTAWETAGNWDAAGVPKSAYPYCYSQIYIKAPAEIAKDTKAHVGRLDIVNDRSSYTGKLTINSGAMLIVYDKVNRIENWSTKVRLATISEDIYIGSERDDSALSWRENGALNGALIMGDYDREEQADSATVQFASLAYTKRTWTTSETSWGERDVNQYIGIPFAHTQVSDYKPYDIYTYTNVYLYSHDRWNNSWAPMSKNQDMYEFSGYDLICFSIAPDEYTNPKPIFDLKGELASTEDQRIHLRGYEGLYGAEENESMLANSWTAPIHISSFEVSDFENAEATIYMFNAGTAAEYDGNMEWASNYSTYPGQYTAIPINDLKLHPYYYEGYKTIPSMQSFSVITLDNDGNSLTKHDLSYLTMDYKRLVYDPAVEAVGVPTETMHAPRRVPTMEEEPLAIMLHVHGVESGLGDRIRLLEREDFSFGRDNGWETSKLLGIIEAPSLYAVTEVGDQATVAVPDVEGLALTFQAGEYDNVYTFNFEYEESDEPLYLLDKKTGIYTRVLTENTYSFVTTDKNFIERFMLTRNYQMPEVATGLENTNADSSLNERVQKVLINDMIYILRDGHIYDATGKMLK